MAERKPGAPTTGKPQSGPPAPPSPPAQTATRAKDGRKAWVKKTPVEVVLEQIGKQEEKVNDLREPQNSHYLLGHAATHQRTRFGVRLFCTELRPVETAIKASIVCSAQRRRGVRLGCRWSRKADYVLAVTQDILERIFRERGCGASRLFRASRSPELDDRGYSVQSTLKRCHYTFLNNSERLILSARAILFVIAKVVFFSPRSTAPM
jgi:hypothetical protein